MPDRSSSSAWTAWLLALLAVMPLGGCRGQEPWQLVDMRGSLPALDFALTRAEDGKQVSALDYRGKIVILEFGYTSCPDICPATLTSLSSALNRIGRRSEQVSVLFVTVDPDRDDPSRLRQYIANFSPRVNGLRGSPDQLARVARRYRVAYSVKVAPNPADTEVMHSSTLFIFDKAGNLRLLAPRIDEVEAIAHDLRILVDEA